MNPLRSLRLAVVALLTSLGVAAPAAPDIDEEEVLEPGPAHAAARTVAANALVARILGLAQAADGAALIEIARQTAVDTTLPPAARERVLYEIALALANVESTPQGDALLGELSGHRPAVDVWQYDGPHRIAVPLYEVAAAARYAQRRQEEERARLAAAEAVERGDLCTSAVLAGALRDPSARRGARLALEEASADRLSICRDGLLAAGDEWPPDLVEVVARRLRDADLMRDVLARADSPLALAIVRDARANFGDDEARGLLSAAIARTDVASAALLQLGGLAVAEPAVQATLFDALADPQRGGSAAAALAAAHDGAIAAALRSWVIEQSDEKVARRGILALRLDGSDAARRELSRIAADPSLSGRLRAEAAW
jgi:hypothetical protein